MSRPELNESCLPEVLSVGSDVMKLLSENSVNNVYLTGGTAVALLAGEYREVSRDLDFFVSPDDKDSLESLFNGKFVEFKSKPTFKSTKLQSEKDGVELDFIVMQKIVVDFEGEELVLVIELDEDVIAMSSDIEVNGTVFRTLPIELIFILKLFAGRGLDLHKFDIVDCESLLKLDSFDFDKLRFFLNKLLEGKAKSGYLNKLMSNINKISVKDDAVAALVEKLSSTIANCINS